MTMLRETSMPALPKQIHRDTETPQATGTNRPDSATTSQLSWRLPRTDCLQIAHLHITLAFVSKQLLKDLRCKIRHAAAKELEFVSARKRFKNHIVNALLFELLICFLLKRKTGIHLAAR